MAEYEVSRLSFNGDTYEIADELARQGLGTAQIDIAEEAARLDAVDAGLAGRITNLETSAGAVLVAKTKSARVDTSKIYVYTGSESGMTAGHWYYHNGTAWVDGGAYSWNLDAIDATLTLSNKGADAKVVGDRFNLVESDVSDLKSDIIENNSYDIIQPYQRLNLTTNGVTYSWNGNSCSVSGTSSPASFNVIFSGLNSLPFGMKAGQNYYVEFSSVSVQLQIIKTNTQGQIVEYIYNEKGSNRSKWITIPNDTTGLVVRLYVAVNANVNEVVEPKILTYYSNKGVVKQVTTMLENIVAGVYDQASDYVIGDYCLYNDNLYKCKVNISSGESWDSTHWENVNVGLELERIVDGIFKNNSYDVVQPLTRYSRTLNGVTYTWDGSSCHVQGTASTTSFNPIFASTDSLPYGVEPGKSYYVDFKSTTVMLQIYAIYGDSSTEYLFSDKGPYCAKWITIPANAVGLGVRLYSPVNAAVNETVSPKLLTWYTNEMLSKSGSAFYGVLPEEGDLNDFDYGCWLLPSGMNYVNSPLADANYGILFCYKGINAIFQVVFGGGSKRGTIFIRNSLNGSYNTWASVVGGGGGGEVTQIFNNYENTYNVTASPSITTDTNSYLSSTGDTTDVTASIVAMLTQTGICRLGKGDYYVQDLVMPDNTTIVGCGYSSRIILIGSSDGFAVKMGSNCVVQNVRIEGSLTNITPSIAVGGRHGILFEGNYTAQQTAKLRGIIDNVYVRNFSGGGITCYDTGYGTQYCLEVTNVYMEYCSAGINISYWSEFHKFTNIKTTNCYYGCINNGGNSVFVNCDFSRTEIGFLIDNSSNQSPNDGHGSCVGCLFNHISDNNGDAIKLLNCKNGFVFNACQINARINIENSNGIMLTGNLTVLDSINIDVNGGGCVLFADSLYHGNPTINITNGAVVKFVNCYNRMDGTPITI